MKVRLRIAPSPTGYPHIGTIWQALVNYAFAKKHHGRFIVRIEDTDRKRYVPGAEKKLFQALDWFGLTPDESPFHGGKYGPYRQSERMKLYQEYAHQLVKEGKAYYCFCSQKRLDEVRKKMVKAGKPPMYDGYCRRLDPVIAAKRAKVGGQYVIRLKVPQEETIVVNDLLRGEVKFASLTVDDQVLLKSDGLPTYHLAVVVDDHLMEISHMVRGEEWLSSGPKQVLLYDFFGWEKPVFIHTPIIRNPDKSKLSKRQGHASVSWYQENGYLAEAILNFLALLGWSHPREKTIFSLKEFIKFFELKDLSVVGPIVDLKKLDYLNGVYLRQTKDKRLVQLIKPYLKFKLSEEVLEKIIPLIKERMVKLTDVNELVDFLVKEIKYKPSLLFYKTKDKNLIKKQLSLLLSALERIDWRVKKITQALQEICQTHGWSKGQFFMALRVAVTGKTVTPPLFESLEILGKSETLKRIEKALSLL